MPKVIATVIKNGGTEQDAYDVFQESILKLYDYVKKGSFKTEYSVGGFVVTIARNRFIDVIRKRNKHIDIQDPVVEPVYAELNTSLTELISEEKEALIDEMLNGIGERCKQLLIYSIFYGLSMKEICEKMGFSTENGAKTRRHKCKQRLIKHLKENPHLLEQLKA